jgi:hypothetical protein
MPLGHPEMVALATVSRGPPAINELPSGIEGSGGGPVGAEDDLLPLLEYRIERDLPLEQASSLDLRSFKITMEWTLP